MAGDATRGVEVPLALVLVLAGTFWDERRNTPPDPACWADLAFAALEMSSDIIPLLPESAGTPIPGTAEEE